VTARGCVTRYAAARLPVRANSRANDISAVDGAYWNEGAGARVVARWRSSSVTSSNCVLGLGVGLAIRRSPLVVARLVVVVVVLVVGLQVGLVVVLVGLLVGLRLS